MNLQDARTLAELHLEQHGLDKQGWSFQWHDKKRVRGQCRYSDKVISLDMRYAKDNDERFVENTIKHEVAHALVGPKVNHGRAWRAQAEAIGCDIELRRSPEIVVRKGKYTLICPSCGHEKQMHAKPKVLRS